MNASDVYQRACASCHGARGTGGLPASEGAPPPRDFTEPSWQATKSDQDLRGIVEKGNGAMPSFGDVLSPSEIDAVVRQVRGFGARAAGGGGGL